MNTLDRCRRQTNADFVLTRAHILILFLALVSLSKACGTLVCDAHSNGRGVTNTEGARETYYDNDLNELTHTTGAESLSFDYDAAGNRICRTSGGQSDYYTFDFEGRLLYVDKNTAGNPGNYYNTYDDRTRRIGRIDADQGATTIVYSGGQSVREYAGATASGNPEAEYVRGKGLGKGIVNPLYSIRGSDLHYSHANHRGDVTSQTKNTTSGVTLTSQTGYGAFGDTVSTSGQTNADPFRANGKEEDPTGLLLEGYRLRDLETGSFIVSDLHVFLQFSIHGSRIISGIRGWRRSLPWESLPGSPASRPAGCRSRARRRSASRIHDRALSI